MKRALFAATSRRAFLAGMIAAISLEDAAGQAGRLRFARPGVPPSPPSSNLAPHAQWGVTGAFDAGYGGSGVAAPVDPGAARECNLNHLFLPWYTFSENYDLVFHADSFGGIAKVRIYLEGNYVDVTEAKWWPYTTSQGLPAYRWGYGVTLDHAAILALNPTGSMHAYAEAFSNNVNIANRVMGPYKLYARAPGVGADKQYDAEYLIDRTAVVDTVDVRYRQIDTALARAVATGKQRPLCTLVTSSTNTATRYKNLSATISRTFATTLATIQPAPGVTAIIGDYSTTSGGGNSGADGLHFRGAPGASLTIDPAAGATSLFGLGFQRMGSSSNNICVFDGAEITCSAPPGAYGTGYQLITSAGFQPGSFWLSRNNTNPYHWIWMDCYIHDMASYGVMLSELVLNNTFVNVSGSTIENPLGAVMGNSISRIGGYFPGLRVHTPAFTLAYNGPGVGKLEKTTAGIKLYVDNVQTGATISATTMLASAFVTHVNANFPDWVAVVDPACPPWSAALINVPGGPPGGSDLDPGLPVVLGVSQVVGMTPFGFTVIHDIHADAVTFYNATYRNVSISFNTIFDITETAPATLQLVNDFSVHHNVFQDRSSAYGSALQNATLGFGVSTHVLFYANSFMGQGMGTFTPTAASIDAYSRIDHVAVASSMDYGNTSFPGADADYRMAYCVLRTPSGARLFDGGNNKLLASPAQSTMWTDPDAAVPDATPLAVLLLSDGKYAGACAPVGAPAAYRGWNLAVT